jgi:YHS domain-containing protein
MNATDPICKKIVFVNHWTPKFAGCESGPVYFCSDKCKYAFEDDDALYYQTCHE